jgi:hypothetical protein
VEKEAMEELGTDEILRKRMGRKARAEVMSYNLTALTEDCFSADLFRAYP